MPFNCGIEKFRLGILKLKSFNRVLNLHWSLAARSLDNLLWRQLTCNSAAFVQPFELIILRWDFLWLDSFQFVMEQQFRTAEKSWPASCSILASSTQRMMIVNNSFQASQSVYNTGGKMTVVLCLQQLWSDAMLNRRPYEYFHIFCAWGRIWMRQQNQCANFLIVFHNNCGPIVLSLRDVTTVQTTDDGPTTATVAYLTVLIQT